MRNPHRAVDDQQTRRIAVDFTHGALKTTGRTLDVAMENDGFFVVEGPDGPLYTRNGSFQAHPDGQLVTVDGLTVSGGNGPIQVPPNTSAEAIEISRDGRLSVNGIEFGQLQFAAADNPEQLIAMGASLFQAGPDATMQPVEGSVLQGFVESANVAQMDELVNILVASRQYEMSQKAMRTIDESVGRRINGN
jgi:flagellar basal body rod protein FlgG